MTNVFPVTITEVVNHYDFIPLLSVCRGADTIILSMIVDDVVQGIYLCYGAHITEAILQGIFDNEIPLRDVYTTHRQGNLLIAAMKHGLWEGGPLIFIEDSNGPILEMLSAPNTYLYPKK